MSSRVIENFREFHIVESIKLYSLSNAVIDSVKQYFKALGFWILLHSDYKWYINKSRLSVDLRQDL